MDEISAHKYLKTSFNTTSSNILLGIGDDCAALTISPGKVVLTTNDTLVENTHFINGQISPQQLGRKSVLVSISDIAAMGGIPRFIMSSIGLGKESSQQFFEHIIDGIKNACEEYGISLVGGNLSGSEKIFVDIMVLGETDPDRIVKRSGAKPGEKIFVTGSLGDSALGFKMLGNKMPADKQKNLIERHFKPEPRIETGKLLAEQKIPGAMIDVSDGLYLDLARITINFDIGAEIFLKQIPLSKSYTELYRDYSDDKYSLAVTGGEDYELLFTSEPGNKQAIKEISAKTGVKISEIGTVTTKPEIKFIDENGNERKFKSMGYTHFN